LWTHGAGSLTVIVAIPTIQKSSYCSRNWLQITLPFTPVTTFLDELITLLFRRETHNEAIRFLDGLMADCARGKIQIQKLTVKRFREAMDLRKRYQDKPDISFTDFTTMVIMRELRITSIVTEDNHFLQVGLGFQRFP
jgi:predicted nucleic acid-binding protein